MESLPQSTETRPKVVVVVDLDCELSPQMYHLIKALWTSGDEIVFMSFKDDSLREDVERSISANFTCPSESYRTYKPEYETIDHVLVMKTIDDCFEQDFKSKVIRDLKESVQVRCVIMSEQKIAQFIRDNLDVTVLNIVGRSCV